MAMRHAARVGDPVTHRSEWQTNLLGAGAALVGAAVVLLGAPLTVPALVGAAGVAANAGGTGLIVGNWFRASRRASAWGHVVSGAPTISIGEAPRPAAKASVGCRVDCHGSFVAEGSRTVIFEDANASREGDRTACAGVLADGYPTVVVGGEPVGDVGEEAHGPTFRVLSAASSLGGPSISLGRATLLRLLSGRSVEVFNASVASVELLGALLSASGHGHVGKPVGAAANTTSLVARWWRLRRGGADGAALREALVRTPGTPARIVEAARVLSR